MQRRTRRQERTRSTSESARRASSTLPEAPKQDRAPADCSSILVSILGPPQAAAVYCSAHQDRLSSFGSDCSMIGLPPRHCLALTRLPRCISSLDSLDASLL